MKRLFLILFVLISITSFSQSKILQRQVVGLPDSLLSKATLTQVNTGLALKLNIADTSGKWASLIYRRGDSVFYRKGNTEYFAFKDSTGGGGGGGGTWGSITGVLSDQTDLQAALDGKQQNIHYYLPEDYGAVGDGVTNDAAAFTACIAAMPSRGGVMYLGAKTYLINTVVNITKPITVLGSGADNSLGSDSAYGLSNPPTKLLNTNGTSSVFDIQSPAVTISKVAFIHTGITAISGCYAVYVSTGTPTWPYTSGFKIYDCSFYKFYDNIHVKNGWAFQIEDCFLNGAINAQVYLANDAQCDAGDGTISGCTFITWDGTTPFGIFHHCGGGLRVVNNKFNSNERIHYYSDITNLTVSRIFTGNSFENHVASAIVFNSDGVTPYVGDAFIVISGNQFATYAIGGIDSTYHIILRNVNGANVGGNVFSSSFSNAKAVHIVTSQNVTIGVNEYASLAARPIVTDGLSTYSAPTVDKIKLGQVLGQGDRYDNLEIYNSTQVPVARMGVNLTFPSYGTIHLGNVTPSDANYAIAGDGSTLIARADNNVTLSGGGTTATLTSTDLSLNNKITQPYYTTSTYHQHFGSMYAQSYSLNNGWISENIYYNGSDFARAATGAGGLFYFAGDEGQFRFYPSAAAGAVGAVYPTQFKVNADGTVAIGGTGISTASGTYTGATLVANTSKVGVGQNAYFGDITTTPNSTLHVGGSFAKNYTSTATGITLGAAHSVVNVTATGQTITLPTAVGIAGRIYTIKLTASGSCTVNTTSSQNIDGSTTYSLASQYKYVTVQSTGSAWIVIANN